MNDYIDFMQSQTQRELDALLEGLNPQQQEAVKARDGKFMVLASAGSGKTLSLTRRIEYLLKTGVDPWRIVGISFTNKAANEIRDRLVDRVGDEALDLKLGTFHSFCMRILLKYQYLLDMQNITVLDDNEALSMISEIAETYGYTTKEGAPGSQSDDRFLGQ